ncbi:4a-hydroxytetrahydrobiopterin dehydratase [Amycolatopsis methanolica]|uniref:4a-hydroxytetrahydrobiopterin dehydratase n=1 Tax=Amycolatopsis methanolica TaxID=1814 RepID=UPI003430DE2C
MPTSTRTPLIAAPSRVRWLDRKEYGGRASSPILRGSSCGATGTRPGNGRRTSCRRRCRTPKSPGRWAGWRGDAGRLSRTVRVPEQAHGALIGRVQRDAATRSDHAQFERRRGELTFTVTTGFPGRVTEPDLWLASRIEALLAELT